MKTVFKQPLRLTDEYHIELPYGAEPLTVQMQRGVPCLWFKCDSEETEKVKRTVYIHGTDHPITNDAAEYISTFQLQGGALVFHVFIA